MASLEREIHNFSVRWIAFEQDVIDLLAELCESPWHMRQTVNAAKKANHGSWRDVLTRCSGA